MSIIDFALVLVNVIGILIFVNFFRKASNFLYIYWKWFVFQDEIRVFGQMLLINFLFDVLYIGHTEWGQ